MEGTKSLPSHTTENDMTLRYYIQWQHAIYRVPQAALRKLAAGDHNGFWQGTTEVRSAVYDYEKHDGWRQRGLPKGLSGCETIRTIDPSVVFFEVWEDAQTLVGRNSRQSYTLGDAIAVRLAEVDVDRRRINFELADASTSGRRSRGRRKPQRTAAPGSAARRKFPKSPRGKKR